MFSCEKKEKTSKYKGVSWESKTGKWRVYFCVKGKSKFGGRFNDELDAGEKVNQLCEELKISLQNPAIRAIPNRQYQVAKKKVFCNGKGSGKKIRNRKIFFKLKIFITDFVLKFFENNRDYENRERKKNLFFRSLTNFNILPQYSTYEFKVL
jgi:hypothetical protein